METRPRTRGGFSRSLFAAIMVLATTGCACFSKGPSVKVKSETELAVEATKDEWMKACEGLSTPMPENSVGNMQQDLIDVSALLAECIKRHNSYVEYMAPVVKKERTK